MLILLSANLSTDLSTPSPHSLPSCAEEKPAALRRKTNPRASSAQRRILADRHNQPRLDNPPLRFPRRSELFGRVNVSGILPPSPAALLLHAPAHINAPCKPASRGSPPPFFPVVPSRMNGWQSSAQVRRPSGRLHYPPGGPIHAGPARCLHRRAVDAASFAPRISGRFALKFFTLAKQGR